jgi:hypothetical protein
MAGDAISRRVPGPLAVIRWMAPAPAERVMGAFRHACLVPS